MREFVAPFKPEELLAHPGDERLWASDLPSVDEWGEHQQSKALDGLVGRLLKTKGKDLAEDKTFSLLFALLQGWPRLEESTKPRIADLLVDTSRRLLVEVNNINKATTKQKDRPAQEWRTVAQVLVFFLAWTAERLLSAAETANLAPRRGKARGRGNGQAQDEAANAEAQEARRTSERLICAVLGELCYLLGKGSLPWLWLGDPVAWQAAAQSISSSGFLILDNVEALKHRESRHFSLRCIAEPLLQEGHQKSTLLVATVSKLMYALRGSEAGAAFVADALLLAHTTPLPRLFLVELPGHCNAGELSSQGAFQRSIAHFLVAVSERLPHIVLANIAVLLPLLDVDCYPLRSAIVESMGALLAAEGRKLPSGAHCDVQAANAEDAPAQDEEVAPQEQELQEVPKRSNAPVAYFSIAPATKKDLLETLLTRSLDKSVWVRYRTLQTLTTLATKSRTGALPREAWSRVLEVATRRMQDSASMSRKASMQLTRALIEFHPYGPALQGSGDERVKAKKLLDEVQVRLRQLQNEEAEEAEQTLADQAAAREEGGEAQPKRRRMKNKTVTDESVAMDIANALQEEDQCDDPEAERERKRAALFRMRDCYVQRLHFVELIDSAESRLRALLASRTNTDVSEAIHVVVELRLKGVPAATRAFDQVLGLVWSRHAPIKDAAVDAFNKMHLDGHDAASAVESLLEMYAQGFSGGTWTYTHLASVQELIQLSAERSFLDVKKVLPQLLLAIEGPHGLMALRALTAIATAAPKEVAAQLFQLSLLLGPKGTALGTTVVEVLERLQLTCELLKCVFTKHKGPLPAESRRHLWMLLQHTICSLVEAFARETVPSVWFSCAQAAMDLTFEIALCPEADDPMQQAPEKLWEQILCRMMMTVNGNRGFALGNGSEDEECAEEMGDQWEQVNASRLGCIVFVAGHLAIQTLIYLEALQSALKRKRMADEDARMEQQREAKKLKQQAQPKKKGKKGAAAPAQEEEDDAGAEVSMGMAGQEEREAEAFAEVAEYGLLFGASSLLDRAKPLIFACLLDSKLKREPLLRRLGAITLCKYMTVSKKFCEANLQLLFSILFPKDKDAPVLPDEETADTIRSGNSLHDICLRQSLLVAVGDLLFRHPNAVEPWTNKLYATLGQTQTKEDDREANDLRLTALLVLTHLVLNDMMKPRAVLLVRALWLTACTHEPTARVARILFQELSKRSTNVIYNLLPEMIARIPEHESSAGRVEGGAEARVQFVMQFVDKEKHIEGLVEKLAIRLEQAANTCGGKAEQGQATQATQGEASQTQGTPTKSPMRRRSKGPEESAEKRFAKATVSALSHAIGGMNYTDRCILRLHDVVVVRKAIHTALSFHEVSRECILSIVEKCRKAKAGPKAGDGGAPVEEVPAAAAAGEAPAGGGGGSKGISGAAAGALDAIEAVVVGLAKGKEDEADQVTAAAGEAAKVAKPKGKAAAKRAASVEVIDDNPGFEEAPAKAKGKGKGRGRGAAGKAAPAKGKKRRAVGADDDEDADEDYEP